MTATTLIHQSGTHSVRLHLDEPATIDLSGHPDYPRLVRVLELAVTYTTTREPGAGQVVEVNGISYVLDDEEDQAAFVHPDYLGMPQEWPAWVRDLVDQHRPPVPGLDECPQCAAPAIGCRIPEHRDGCPRNDPNA